MYILSKLSKSTLGWLNAITGAAKNRCDAFAIALAYVLSQRLALPVERVEDVLSYFRLNHTEIMNRMIDQCNEVTPVNTKLVKQALEAFYMFRYRSLFPLAIPLALRKETGIEDFFGLSKCFSDGMLDVIRKESEELTHFVNGLTTLIDEIEESKKWAQLEEEKDKYVA